MMKKPSALIVVALMLLAVSCASFAYSAYVIVSNTVTVTVTAQASLVLTTNATNLNVGDTLLLTATLSDGLAGQTVSFFENGTIFASALTNETGVATVSVQLINAGTFNYRAQTTHP